MKILRNQIECLKCGSKIASFGKHDHKTCRCGCVDVDGGLDYLRRAFTVAGSYKDESISVEAAISPDYANSCISVLYALDSRFWSAPPKLKKLQALMRALQDQYPWLYAPKKLNDLKIILFFLEEEGLVEELAGQRLISHVHVYAYDELYDSSIRVGSGR